MFVQVRLEKLVPVSLHTCWPVHLEAAAKKDYLFLVAVSVLFLSQFLYSTDIFIVGSIFWCSIVLDHNGYMQIQEVCVQAYHRCILISLPCKDRMTDRFLWYRSPFQEVD